jgi:murein DD-endopeptidase MepM/ murein hydrolase activator NlpD
MACFCAGALVDEWLWEHSPARRATASEAAALQQVRGLLRASGDGLNTEHPVATAGEPPVIASPPALFGSAISELHHHDLQMPIEGAQSESMKGAFAEKRSGRAHEAVDIVAPRNTPIHAVESGTIAKLFVSKAGGNTIYQFDPTGRFCYYYAHLERYADGLREGQRISRGDVIGYVGTSGNAPRNTPHLHFAISELTVDRRWWQGRTIDPYLVFHR